MLLTSDAGELADELERFEFADQPVDDNELKRAVGTQTPAGKQILGMLEVIV